MKKLLLALTCLGIAQAHAILVNWEADSDSAIRVVLSGTDPNQHFDLFSPSSIWHLVGNTFAVRTVREGIDSVTMGMFDSYTILEFDGRPAFSQGRFEDTYPIEQESLVTMDTFDTRLGFEEWLGPRPNSRMTITSRPDPFDVSTWGFETVFQVSGPAYVVPEASGTGMYLAFAASLLFFFRPRNQTA